MEKIVKDAVENLRPALMSDGGAIDVLEVKKDLIVVKITKPTGDNHCKDCFLPDSIIKDMLQSFIKVKGDWCPEIKLVE